MDVDGSFWLPIICQWAHKIELCTTDSLGSSADHSHSGPEAGSVALYWCSGTRRQVKHCSHPTGELEYEPGFYSVFPVRRNGEGIHWHVDLQDLAQEDVPRRTFRPQECSKGEVRHDRPPGSC